MKTVVFGFKSQKIQAAIERELLKGTEQIHKVTKLSARAIMEYLQQNPTTDAVVLVENGEDYQWTIEEICSLTDVADVNVVIVIDETHRNTDYMQQLYRAGITSAIFFQEKHGGISPSMVAGLILNKRGRKAAREYYGIELLKNAVFLDENMLAAAYKALTDDSYGKNIMERYMKVAEGMTAKQNLQFFKKMPRKQKSQVMKYAEFYDLAESLKKKGANLGVRRPKRGLVSMENYEEEPEVPVMQEGGQMEGTSEREPVEPDEDCESIEKELEEDSVKVHVSILDAEVVDNVPNMAESEDMNFQDGFIDFSKLEEEMKEEENREKDREPDEESDGEQNSMHQDDETTVPDEMDDFASLLGSFQDDEPQDFVEEEPAAEYGEEDWEEELEDDEEDTLSLAAKLGIAVSAVAVLLVIALIIFVISSATRSNAAMSSYLANKKTSEIVNDMESGGIQTNETGFYQETPVEDSQKEDMKPDSLTIIGGTDGEQPEVVIDTVNPEGQESEAETDENRSTAVQQVQEQTSQETGSQEGSPTGNQYTYTRQQQQEQTQTQDGPEEDGIGDESSQVSAYKDKAIHTGDIYSGLDVFNYVSANAGTYTIIGEEMKKECHGGDILPGDVVLGGRYQVTVERTGTVTFLLE